MREILFRAKRLNNGEWIYGNYNLIDGIDHYIFNDGQLDSPDNYKVNPDTVGQYTGFKSKDGQYIYEGHFALVKHRFKKYGLYITEVVYQKPGFTLKENHTKMIDYKCLMCVLKVADTKYELQQYIDNPELLNP